MCPIKLYGQTLAAKYKGKSSSTSLPCILVFWKRNYCIGSHDKSFVRSTAILKKSVNVSVA